MSSGNGTPLRVAFYTRISTDEDHQKFSLGAQKDRLEAYCTSQWGTDWQLHQMYQDQESGTHMKRPGLQAMLLDAQAQTFDHLLVFRVDRLSRKVHELASMVDLLKQHEVHLASITEPFDTANPAGKMMLQMLGVFAEFEHATIVERTKAGMAKKASTGRWVGGNPPYGYTHKPESGLVIRDEEAVLVRKIFKWYVIDREGSSSICRQLNQAGHRRRSGRPWDKRAVIYMLQNPLYVGKLRWRELVHEGIHDPIISEILFDKAQEIMKGRREESPGHQFNRNGERLLTGVIKCSKCGSHMIGYSTTKKNSGQRYPYYTCNKRWADKSCNQDNTRADHLEEAIMQDIGDMFRDEQFMARVWEEANRKLSAEKPDIENEISEVFTKIEMIQGKIDRYFKAFEDGSLEPQVCSAKVKDLKAQVDDLESEKRELQARRERLELPAIDKEMLTSLLANFEKVMAAGTNAQRKDLLQRIVKKVVVHGRSKVEIWYGIPNQETVCNLERKAPRVGLEPTTHRLTADCSAD